jgi:predicted adenylyl cyclase CyaB
MKEIEIKLDVNDQKIRDSIIDSHTSIIDQSMIIDIYYKVGRSLKEDLVLRLRHDGKTGQIAFKGPRINNHKKLIIRDEYETIVEDPTIIDKILLSLGYQHRDVVEKIRTKYYHSKFPSLKITIDQYPFIGFYLEVEGDEKEIIKFVSKYKISKEWLDIRNCTETFLDHIKKNKIQLKQPRANFTFEAEKRV